MTCLINQISTYATVRDVIEERGDKVKQLRAEIRTHQIAELKKEREAAAIRYITAILFMCTIPVLGKLHIYFECAGSFLSMILVLWWILSEREVMEISCIDKSHLWFTVAKCVISGMYKITCVTSWFWHLCALTNTQKRLLWNIFIVFFKLNYKKLFFITINFYCSSDH